jgi:predicted TIM-barrel fold metal-dependent hydrolase
MKNGFDVIDADGHMIEPVDIWDRYVEPAFYDRRPIVTGAVGRTFHAYGPCEIFPNGVPTPRPDDQFADVPARYGEAFTDWWSLASRLKAMDAEGIDVMVDFPTNGIMATSQSIKDGQLQAALCRAYNNWASDYCMDAGGRVKYVALVSLADVDQAVAEIERVAQHPQIASVVIRNRGMERMWNRPELDVLWAALADHDLAVCFHGGSHLLRAWSNAKLTAVSHALSFPLDNMLTMGTLIFGGVLERFPSLRAGFYEGNAGWLSWWLARMDDHAVGRQGRFMDDASVELSLAPSDYFLRQCFVACDADEGALQPAVEALNGENIVFNTDYPHPDAPMPGAVDTFLASGLSEAAMRKILWDNPARLYGSRVKKRTEA